jgi:uncharacterized tellurite resistance protein B-like protein
MSQVGTERDQISSFDGIDCVIADSLRFRRKLAIGEDAYTSLRLGKTLAQLWDVGGVAATGAQVAALPAVATTFFSGSGLLSALGIGAAATTPIGWVIAASVVTGGAYYGVTRLFRSYSGTRVDVIPKFINTPIDLLGASLLDLIGSLSIKVAMMDGKFTNDERAVIREHLIEDWGYSPAYVDKALSLIEENINQLPLSEMVQSFSSFVQANPDCNFLAMRQELIAFLTDLAKADGHFDEREEMAIERIERITRAAEKILPELPAVPTLPSIERIAAVPAGAVDWVSRRLRGEK